MPCQSHPSKFFWPILFCGLLVICTQSGEAAANENRQPAGKIPALVAKQLQAGQSADVIILFDTTETENEITALRKSRNVIHDDAPILARRALRYREQKKAVLDKLLPDKAEILHDYSHLPMAALRLHSKKQLDQLAGRADIIAIYADQPVYPHLYQSLPLIEQPTAASVGYTGTGATIAILDTGVNWDHSAFGSCTAPGSPSTCKVAVAVEFATDDGSNKDSSGHGSNVAAIALGVAPGARVAALDVFNSDGGSYDSIIISAINWAITNKTTYNIVSLNMSLGDGGNHTALCSNKFTNPYVTPITNARAAGILPVASSGNEAFTGGIASPACTPGIVSVGAVYDANNLGSRSWTACTDSTTAADKVTCFSNSASFLTMLAPGAFITAAGYSYGGTSQAAPHVAGAAAVLRAAWPGETLDATQNRMTTEGMRITDSRNGLSFPRLSLTGALQLPPEDLFAEPASMDGATGSLTTTNTTATKETGEPAHAGNSGGHSLWWTWTAPASHDYSFCTTGSTFDTLLAIYQGATLSTLTLIADNDDADSTATTSCLVFNAVEGEEYLIAVDGKDGTSGAVSLQWESIPENTDIPMLPPWGIAGMGIMLSAVATLIQRKNRPTSPQPK